MAEAKQSSDRSSSYATSADFCGLFTSEMSSLYLLAFLLTAAPDKAEQCFLTALENCQNVHFVFKEWVGPWARREIVHAAIRMIEPRRKDPGRPLAAPEADPKIAAVLQLPPFQRFIFVMSALDRYSYQHCALLLGSSRQEVFEEQTRVLQSLAESATTQPANRANDVQQSASRYGKYRFAFEPSAALLAKLA